LTTSYDAELKPKREILSLQVLLGLELQPARMASASGGGAAGKRE
jgi:hypothetical protein